MTLPTMPRHLLLLAVLIGMSACNIPTAQNVAVSTEIAVAPTLTAPLNTATPAPTETALPTETPEPSATPTATETPHPTETSEPTNTPTPDATATFTPEPTPTETPTPEVSTLPVAAQINLPNIVHDYQRLNNCGPVSTAMALSYYGSTLTQYDIAPVVKGGPTDTNAAPYELSNYIQAQGFAAPVRVNGDLDVLRALLSNGIPVIVQQWLDRHDDELTAHYRLVRGYDQPNGIFIVGDSYVGANVRYTEADFDRWWVAFNRLYIPVYRPDQEPLVKSIIGEANWDETVMWQQDAARAEAELASNPNFYSWYNLGEARLRLGDAEGAVDAFEQALAFDWPVRWKWYIFAYLEAFNTTGRYERILEETQAYTNANVEEMHYYRGQALEGLGRPQEAIAEYQAAVNLNGHYPEPAQALARLGG